VGLFKWPVWVAAVAHLCSGGPPLSARLLVAIMLLSMASLLRGQTLTSNCQAWSQLVNSLNPQVHSTEKKKMVTLIRTAYELKDPLLKKTDFLGQLIKCKLHKHLQCFHIENGI
jgi:hypothetical protein